MKLLITADPEIPVPPLLYGGIERIVDFVVEGAVCEGLEVVLLAHAKSQTSAVLRPWPGTRSQHPLDLFRNAAHLARIYQEDGPFDVVHSFGRLAYLLSILGEACPKIQSYQRQVTHRSVGWASWLAQKTLTFTSLSRHIAQSGRVGTERWEVIYNGVRTDRYAFRPSVPADAPLVFLGRVEWIKGPHHAIAIAKRTGRRLILAGNRAESGPEAEYFEREIAPHLNDRDIQYVGPVDDSAKDKLLGQAAALLFPIEWDEPFGIVIVEALACGTPVLAVNRGAVPEIIEHGVTGWLSHSADGLDEGVRRLDHLDRLQCRRQVEARFSADVITRQYLNLYRQLAAERLNL